MLPTIAVDIDGVLANYTKAVATRGNLGSPPEPATFGLIELGWFTDSKQRDTILADVEGDLDLLDILDPTSVGALEQLAERGAHIRYISSRRNTPEVRAATILWLKNQGFPNPTELTLTNHKDRCDYHIIVDDNPATIDAAHAAGKTVVIYDHPYNAHIETAPRLRRITHLSELAERLLARAT